MRDADVPIELRDRTVSSLQILRQGLPDPDANVAGRVWFQPESWRAGRIPSTSWAQLMPPCFTPPLSRCGENCPGGINPAREHCEPEEAASKTAAHQPVLRFWAQALFDLLDRKIRGGNL